MYIKLRNEWTMKWIQWKSIKLHCLEYIIERILCQKFGARVIGGPSGKGGDPRVVHRSGAHALGAQLEAVGRRGGAEEGGHLLTAAPCRAFTLSILMDSFLLFSLIDASNCCAWIKGNLGLSRIARIIIVHSKKLAKSQVKFLNFLNSHTVPCTLRLLPDNPFANPNATSLPHAPAFSLLFCVLCVHSSQILLWTKRTYEDTQIRRNSRDRFTRRNFTNTSLSLTLQITHSTTFHLNIRKT